MNELALFAGAGGGILGGKLLGWRTVCAVEWEPYAASVLAARQNDGLLPPFPIWDDVQTFDGRPWCGIVDVVSGGFPCQDISAAGKGAGIEGARSGMWGHMVRIICEVRPRYVFVENSPMLTSRGLHRVLGDLAEMGFDARWGVLGAAHLGAPHVRERMWIVANSSEDRRLCGGMVRDINQQKGERRNSPFWSAYRIRTQIRQANKRIPEQWLSEPSTDGMADGVAYQVDRLAATGNGQVPRVAATAWRLLTEDK
jgi:DNA (cytosine-5)-methyltransferase 1